MADEELRFYNYQNDVNKYPIVGLTYSGDLVTQAIIYQDYTKTVIIDTIDITYSGTNPIIHGTLYRNMIFNPATVKLEYNTIATTTSSTQVPTQIVRATAMAVSINRFELISNTLNQVLSWPSAAEKITVVSTNINDTLLGTGVRTITIIGIDALGAEITEDISMNGATPVITTLDYKRLNSITALTVGSNDFAMGTITFTNASLQLIDTISAGFNRASSLKYTVPTSNQLTLKALRLNGDRLSTYDVKLMIWPLNIPPYVYSQTTITGGQSDLDIFPGEVTLSAETDIAAVVRRLNGPATGANCSRINAELIGTQIAV